MSESYKAMKPYYQDDAVTIYHGDCKNLLMGMRCDLLLTDPPYGIGESAAKNRSRGTLARPTDYGTDDWDKSTRDEEIKLALQRTKNAIIFGGNYYDLPPSSCWLVWDKENGQSDFADCELAWTNFKSAVRLFRYRWAGMLQGNMAKKEIREHPTQKPLPLIKWCIENYSKQDDWILDPFMGSGTTLRAAKDLGRKAIGIEIEEKYCEIAAKRMSQEVLDFGETS